jgi:hypothetical protein
MTKIRSVALKLEVLVLILFFLLIFIPQPVSGIQGLPTVNIALTEPSKTAHVGPGDTGEVTFHGTVRVTLNQATRVIVSLDADDTWNSAVVSPESMLFSASGEQPFTVNVTAPPRESFSTIGTVTVTGRWVMYPGALSGPAQPPDGTSGRIDIAQYFLFSLKTPESLVETIPNSEALFKLIIENEGNHLDSFSAELLNFNELSAKGLLPTISNSHIEIFEFSNETIDIFVKTPSSRGILGSHEIKIKVWSEKGLNEGVPPQVFTFILKVSESLSSGTGGSSADSDYIEESIGDLRNNGDGLISESYLIMISILVVIFIVLFLIFKWKENSRRYKIKRRFK